MSVLTSEGDRSSTSLKAVNLPFKRQSKLFADNTFINTYLNHVHRTLDLKLRLRDEGLCLFRDIVS